MKKYDKEFIPYQEALELKELGFDEHCFGWYTWTGKDLILKNNSYVDINPTPAPTFSQAFRWFREKYNLKSWIEEHTVDNFLDLKPLIIYVIRPHKLTDYRKGEVCASEKYEVVELMCLRKLIEIVKKNQQY